MDKTGPGLVIKEIETDCKVLDMPGWLAKISWWYLWVCGVQREKGKRLLKIHARAIFTDFYTFTQPPLCLCHFHLLRSRFWHTDNYCEFCPLGRCYRCLKSSSPSCWPRAATAKKRAQRKDLWLQVKSRDLEICYMIQFFWKSDSFYLFKALIYEVAQNKQRRRVTFSECSVQ